MKIFGENISLSFCSFTHALMRQNAGWDRPIGRIILNIGQCHVLVLIDVPIFCPNFIRAIILLAYFNRAEIDYRKP